MSWKPTPKGILMQAAARSGEYEQLRSLIDGGGDVNVIEGGKTALYAGCEAGQLRTVRLLLNRQAEVDLPCAGGRTPLYAAVCAGHAELATLLLDRGASPGRAGADGATPLAAACFHGQPECAVILLERGAAALRPFARQPLCVGCLCGCGECAALRFGAGIRLNATRKPTAVEAWLPAPMPHHHLYGTWPQQGRTSTVYDSGARGARAGDRYDPVRYDWATAMRYRTGVAGLQMPD